MVQHPPSCTGALTAVSPPPWLQHLTQDGEDNALRSASQGRWPFPQRAVTKRPGQLLHTGTSGRKGCRASGRERGTFVCNPHRKTCPLFRGLKCRCCRIDHGWAAAYITATLTHCCAYYQSKRASDKSTPASLGNMIVLMAFFVGLRK